MNTPNGDPMYGGAGGHGIDPQSQGQQGPQHGPGAEPGAAGPMPPHGEAQFHHQPWAGMPPNMPPPMYWQQAYGPPGYAMPPYPPTYGAYEQPGPNPAQSQMPPEIEAMLNNYADQNGLGMLKGLFNFQDGDFWKGALVGAAIVMLVTNEELRNSLINSAAKAAEAVKSGINGGAEPDMSDDESEQDESTAEK